MIKKLVLAVAAIVCFMAPAVAQAYVIKSDPNKESIQSFESNITVGKDAMLDVTETIVYDMDGVAHHGLERLIPVSTHLQNEDKFINYNIKVLGVSEDSDIFARYSLAQENAWYRIRIGDPNITKTGVHTYTIHYTYGPSISQTSKGDLFDYNIFGTYWVLPAKSVKSIVTFPDGVTIKDQLCYTGPAGSQDQNCTVTAQGQTVTVASDRQFSPNEGLDLQVLMPNGSFTAYTVMSDKAASPPISANNWIAIIFVVGLFGAILTYVINSLIRMMRDHLAKKRQTIVPQYEPPDKLSPAEVGMLVDKQFGAREVVATLVALASRGYLKIHETQPKSLFKKAKYDVDLIKRPEMLANYETELLNLLFIGDIQKTQLPQTASLSSVNRNVAPITLKQMTKDVEASLKAKSYFAAKRNVGVKKFSKRFYVIAGLIVGLVVLGSIVTRDIGFFEVVVGVIFIGLAVFVQTEKYTQLGYQEWAKVKGFEWFLTVTEKDRMKFENAPAKTPELFNKLLPYAIALGVEKKWAKQFQELDLTNTTDWYDGSTNLTAFALASNLSSSFTPAIRSSVTPVSSSGGFGGGFSGGGGGGGGGGGW